MNGDRALNAVIYGGAVLVLVIGAVVGMVLLGALAKLLWLLAAWVLP